MPELPDIVAYISALEPRIVGQPLQRVRLASPFVLRTVQPPLADVEGRAVRELRRIGKRIAPKRMRSATGCVQKSLDSRQSEMPIANPITGSDGVA